MDQLSLITGSVRPHKPNEGLYAKKRSQDMIS